jgi:hypothetical protein
MGAGSPSGGKRRGVNDPNVVSDASAVLAPLKEEEFGQFDP